MKVVLPSVILLVILLIFLVVKAGGVCECALTSQEVRDQVGAVVTQLPPTAEVSGSNPRTYVGKLVVVC